MGTIINKLNEKSILSNWRKTINEIIDKFFEYAEINHASKDKTYGIGNDEYYGHIKLSDEPSDTYTANSDNGIAATPKAVKTVLDEVQDKCVHYDNNGNATDEKTEITATNFIGNLNGTADRAIADKDGNDIIATYATKEEVDEAFDDLVSNDILVGTESVGVLISTDGTVTATSSMTAPKFVGLLEGTADRAIADEDGNDIIATYATKEELTKTFTQYIEPYNDDFAYFSGTLVKDGTSLKWRDILDESYKSSALVYQNNYSGYMPALNLQANSSGDRVGFGTYNGLCRWDYFTVSNLTNVPDSYIDLHSDNLTIGTSLIIKSVAYEPTNSTGAYSIANVNNTDEIRISGGTDFLSGSNLILYPCNLDTQGSTNEEASLHSGSFALNTNNSDTGKSYILRGLNDGTLRWSGNNFKVSKIYVTSTTDAETKDNTRGALFVGNIDKQHLSIDFNEIFATDATGEGAGTLYLQADGGNVVFGEHTILNTVKINTDNFKINGETTFNGTTYYNASMYNSYTMEKGIIPDKLTYKGLYFTDKSGTDEEDTYGSLVNEIDTNNNVTTYISAYLSNTGSSDKKSIYIKANTDGTFEAGTDTTFTALKFIGDLEGTADNSKQLGNLDADTYKKSYIEATSSLGNVTLTRINGETTTLLTGDETLSRLKEFTGATSTTDGTTGLVKKPVSGQQGLFLRGDATWAKPADTKVTSVNNHYTPTGTEEKNASDGTLTDITNGTGVNVLTGLKMDAKGHITGVNSISLKSTDTDTTYTTFTGATASTNGTSGLVPAPTSGNQAKFLRADGTWQTPTDTNTDTKVTAVENHYTPTSSTSKSATGGTDTNITNLASGSGVQVLTGLYMDAAGHITGVKSVALRSVDTNTDTHYSATLITGATNSATANTATANSATYLNLIENGTVRNSHQIIGIGAITVTTNSAGKITISGTDTNTDTKVTNTLATTSKAYITGTTNSATNTGTQVFDTGVYLTTTAGELYASHYSGSSATLTGTVSASAVYNAVWNDYAEFYPRGEVTEVGDIISLDTSSPNKEQYVKATKENKKIVGIHSDSFGHLIGGEKAPEGEDFVEYNLPKFIPVGLKGRCKTKVIGKIKLGDDLVISNIAGVASAYNKEIDDKYDVFGYACENNENENIKLVKIHIK